MQGKVSCNKGIHQRKQQFEAESGILFEQRMRIQIGFTIHKGGIMRLTRVEFRGAFRFRYREGFTGSFLDFGWLRFYFEF